MATICFYCGLHLDDAATFCPTCGRPLEKNVLLIIPQQSLCIHVYQEGKHNNTHQTPLFCTIRTMHTEVLRP